MGFLHVRSRYSDIDGDNIAVEILHRVTESLGNLEGNPTWRKPFLADALPMRMTSIFSAGSVSIQKYMKQENWTIGSSFFANSNGPTEAAQIVAEKATEIKLYNKLKYNNEKLLRAF